MKILLRLSAVLLMSALGINAYTSTHYAATYGGVKEAASMTTTSAFSTNSVQTMNTQSLNKQSLSMYGASSQLMYGNYTVPMAAKYIGDGETLEEDDYYEPRRKVIGGGGYRPDYDPEDPFHTPVGDVPVMLLIVFAAIATYLRYRKLKADQLVPTAQAAQPAE